MIRCLDDVIADCLVYYHVDIESLWAHEAVRLVERLPRYWQVVPDSDPIHVLSAVYAHLEAEREEAAEQRVMDGAEVARMTAGCLSADQVREGLAYYKEV